MHIDSIFSIYLSSQFFYIPQGYKQKKIHEPVNRINPLLILVCCTLWLLREQATHMSGKTHPCHPEHELEQKNYKSPYTCSGCKMQGFGKRYACDRCDYVLHDDCMFPATHPIHHPFFGSSAFEFLHRPESAGPGISLIPYGHRLPFNLINIVFYGRRHHHHMVHIHQI